MVARAAVAMGIKEQLIRAAEDELTEYSTDLRKIEKLRPKVAFRLSTAEREHLAGELRTELDSGAPLGPIVEKQRQTVALPFWGLCGLGLLLGFLGALWGWGVAIAGCWGAFVIQRWGWQLQARRLLLATLEDIERRAAR
ncbi:gll1873 [Gloeobacter violaceus PCC 7421]|uniref:Gll1873 protein n=2 Tax=Gloeobacter violaceus TaxID=33072 RepID=Q7NJF9_GLOVI|nr:gll1873 [Gloeobacter violaceus PCC 7421]